MLFDKSFTYPKYSLFSEMRREIHKMQKMGEYFVVPAWQVMAYAGVRSSAYIAAVYECKKVSTRKQPDGTLRVYFREERKCK